MMEGLETNVLMWHSLIPAILGLPELFPGNLISAMTCCMAILWHFQPQRCETCFSDLHCIPSIMGTICMLATDCLYL